MEVRLLMRSAAEDLCGIELSSHITNVIVTADYTVTFTVYLYRSHTTDCHGTD